jgi:hypothetical protein
MMLLRSSHTRRDFDPFLYKDDRLEDYGRFQRVFKWKYGARNIRNYFAD